MTDQLHEAWENAFTIESMPENRKIVSRIGEITGEYIYEFFQDNAGDYWFKTKFKDTGKYTNEPYKKDSPRLGNMVQQQTLERLRKE